MPQIGREIRRIREERDLNQAQLSVMIGTGPAAISRIENGRQIPSTVTLQKLAEALGVGVEDFFPKDQARLPFEDDERNRAGEGQWYVAGAGGRAYDLAEVRSALEGVGVEEGTIEEALRVLAER
jgi:transcriptional regulator with XRE-family HTH domain